MDYEKKYNELIERIKEFHEAGDTLTKAQMEIILPELVESEDERVRKFISETVFCSYGDSQEYLDVLAYLEKQKEQKPTEWSDKDKRSLRTTLECLNYVSCQSKTPVVNWLNSLPKRFNLRPKVEWSEKDNTGWDEAFACVTDAEKAAKNEEELQNAVTAEKWLKEIKFKYCAHPVKQEWSEEDEKMRDKTLVSLNALIDCAPHKYEEPITKQINWLQVLRHKPHWKPSEIQMRYLDVAIAEADSHKSYNLAYGLEKLKDDLKKL